MLLRACIAAVFAAFSPACDDTEPCSDSFGQHELELRGAHPDPGGWDANGRTMFGLTSGMPVISGVAIESAELDGEAIEIFDVNAKGLVARTAGGEIKSGGELRGATIVVRDAFGLRNISVREGSTSLHAPTFVRYVIDIDGVDPCPLGQVGIFVNGSWDRNGAKGGADGISFACELGAVFKCVSWGYAPWTTGDDVHQTCTRVVRADYCGDGRSYTEEGTLIWISDSSTFPEVELRGFSREAGWGPDGAVCIDHQRFDAISRTGEVVLPSCAAKLPACDGSTGDGALLYNGSQMAPLTVCVGE